MNVNINRLVGKKIADRYCITGEIGAGGMGRVFRAMPFDDPSHDVAIKVILRNRELNSEDLLRFQKEAALMSRLHHPNIICFHELGLLGSEGKDSNNEFGNGYYIVMEVATGSNLKESLARDGRKDLAFFFQVGLQVTAALDYTHGKNIIHRDIKPQNIVVGKAIADQRDLMVKVLDFGVARLAEAMHFSPSNGGNLAARKGVPDIAGTPLYMAPEQTHLLDAPIDHRVDLYSLGCVLYEILVGRPPFSANTREKLERQHVYSSPEPLTSLRPDVPPIIEQIVHKLLSKHPDERYQSAFALHTDLLRAKRRLERRDRPASISFPLGLNDRFQSVSANLKLVGRDKELQALIDGYSATIQEKGRSRLSVVQGTAGTGKTRLLSEFRNYLAQRKIRFISANFSQHENALPFNALANGFNDYLIRVLKSQPHEAEELRRKVKTLLGEAAHRVAAVVPGLKPFISDDIEKPASTGGASDFHNFAKAFSDFTRCLAIDNQPVVFIFDDLHWADEKSLELIDQFFSHNNSQRFFMIISHRTNDPSTSPRFKAFIEKFQKLRRRFEEILLEPFTLEAVKQITENMLAAPDHISDELVEFLHKTAQGNPMHLVELLRSIVARDLIYLTSSRAEGWTFNYDAIVKTTHNLVTVDLALSRIQNFQDYDKSVLEIAATIGLSFQYELLLLEGRKESVKVMKTLQLAIDEGLITRVPDDPDLKHLGKTYSFTHWRARDAIYTNVNEQRRRELHLSIAQNLEMMVTNPTPKTIFALAHHYNNSLDNGTAQTELSAQKAVIANVSAGKTAKIAGSWQSAERYFENAYSQMQLWPTTVSNSDQRFEVIENLADLAALQRRHGDALKKYNELTGLPLNKNMWASVAYKTANLQLVSGIISNANKSVENYLNKTQLPVPKLGFKEFFSVILWLIVDVLPQPKRKHRLYLLLKQVFAKSDTEGSGSVRKNFGARLYSVGQTLYLQQNPKLALVYHHHSLRECFKPDIPAVTIIRAIGDRGALLGYLGFFKVGYRIMDLALDVSRSLKDKSSYGYLALMRALTLDFVKDKDDEVSDHLKAALRYLPPEEERINYGVALEFKMYRELLRGNLEAVIRYSRIVPDTLPTRNWLSPRTLAIAFYAFLLEDARDAIVHQGEQYLKRRDQVSARSDDLFVYMINTFVTFARGEIDKTRKYYAVAMRDFINSSKGVFLFPFEEDFVALFAYTFPLIFEQEYGRRLMRDDEMHWLLERLEKRVSKIKGRKRGVASMLIARSREVVGKKQLKFLYDHALHAAKINNQQLPMILIYLWFGNYLLKNGQRRRVDYLKRAHALSSSLRMTALVEYIEKLMERRGIEFRPAKLKENPSEQSQRYGPYRSQMVFEHLEHISEVLQLDMAPEQNFEESLAILQRQYRCARIICAINKESDRKIHIFYPFTQEIPERSAIEYIEPYFNIRSTLFLPRSDAPWAVNTTPSELNATHHSALERITVIQNSPTEEPTPSQGIEETLVLEGAGQMLNTEPKDRLENLIRTGGVTIINSSALGESRHRSLQMSAIIPLRTENGNCGVLYLEDVDLSSKETTQCRSELDVFGAQLGLFISRKLDISTDSTIDLSLPHGPTIDKTKLVYNPASYTLETVPWLKTWTHGKLRAERETAWYLGLAISADYYLLAYCRLNGAPSIRERISAMLWNQFLATRSLFTASGRNNFEPSEIRDEVAALLTCLASAKELEAVSLSFTLFSRDKKTASSGHFGPSRPIILCQENLVMPQNQVIMTLNNGRDLRYWSVNAGLNGPHAYLLSHDSSKLDANSSEAQKRSLKTTISDPNKVVDMHKVMERMIMKENMPRYYVGCMLLEEQSASEDTIPAYDKAE